MTLTELIEDSAYKLSQFKPARITAPQAQQSFSLKAQSEHLLEAAKRAVEIAIEQDEAAGMAYLVRQGAMP